MCNPVPLPDLCFDSFSYPVASIVFGDMSIVSLFLVSIVFLANPRSCLESYRLAQNFARPDLLYTFIVIVVGVTPTNYLQEIDGGRTSDTSSLEEEREISRRDLQRRALEALEAARVRRTRIC